MAASKATPRGNVTKYLYERDSYTVEQPDYIINEESDDLDASEASLDGVATGMADADLASMVAGHNWIDDTAGQQLDYNPKTDRFGVIPNQYSIYKPE